MRVMKQGSIHDSSERGSPDVGIRRASLRTAIRNRPLDSVGRFFMVGGYATSFEAHNKRSWYPKGATQLRRYTVPDLERDRSRNDP